MNQNGRQYDGPRISNPKPPTATPKSGTESGLFVPSRFVQDQTPQERSLQINIDSEDDAKSVIQNLQTIKEAFDSSGVNSVEFCIAESVVKKTSATLTGAINWCRTYVKQVQPFPGNVLFPLPSFKDLTASPKRAQPSPTATPESTTPGSASGQPLVKPQRPVRADLGAK